MNLALRFREQLPGAVITELDHLLSQINTIWNVEHNRDGTHASVTTTALTVPLASLQVGGQKIPEEAVVTTGPLTDTNVSETILIASVPLEVTSCRAVFRAAGSANAAVTLEKLTGTTAPGAGTAILTATLALTGGANIVQTGTLTGTVATRQLAVGQRLGIVLSGTLGGLRGLLVTVGYKRQ